MSQIQDFSPVWSNEYTQPSFTSPSPIYDMIATSYFRFLYSISTFFFALENILAFTVILISLAKLSEFLE